MVRLQWAALLAGLRGYGWDVVQPRAMEAYYRAGGRVGTVSIHDRGAGVWRYVVDGAGVRHRSRLKLEYPTRPQSFQGPHAAHEITLMLDEVEVVTGWLLRWLAAYNDGQPLPDMPDGTPYDGGYQWTKAKDAQHREVYGG